MAEKRTLPSGIRQVGSGKYQVRYTGPDGKRYSGGTYRTKTDVRNALALVHASISDRTWKSKKARVEDGELSGRSLLSEWSEEWIRFRSSKKTGRPLATGTIRNYRTTINAGLKSFDRPIETITPGQIRTWWTSYRLEFPRAANNAYKYLNSLLTFAVERGAIDSNPCAIEGASSWQPRAKGRLSSKESIDRFIFEAADPWRAFFSIVLYGGLRRGEVAALRVGDVIRAEGDSSRLAIEEKPRPGK